MENDFCITRYINRIIIYDCRKYYYNVRNKRLALACSYIIRTKDGPHADAYY